LSRRRLPKQTKKGLTYGEAPQGGPLYLIVRLKPGWRLAEDGKAFESEKGERVQVPEGVGSQARLVHHLPALASRKLESLSNAERELATFVQLYARESKTLHAARSSLSALTCVTSVDAPPLASLP
jgi:hypothetical protein